MDDSRTLPWVAKPTLEDLAKTLAMAYGREVRPEDLVAASGALIFLEDCMLNEEWREKCAEFVTHVDNGLYPYDAEDAAMDVWLEIIRGLGGTTHYYLRSPSIIPPHLRSEPPYSLVSGQPQHPPSSSSAPHAPDH